MNQSFWKPGSIVKLKEPYRLSSFDMPGIPEPIRKDRKWKGFTYGIIVQVIGHEHEGVVSHVSLHLYDPIHSALYVEHDSHGIPMYVDYHVDELIPWKDGEAPGYDPIKPE